MPMVADALANSLSVLVALLRPHPKPINKSDILTTNCQNHNTQKRAFVAATAAVLIGIACVAILGHDDPIMLSTWCETSENKYKQRARAEAYALSVVNER